MSNFTVRNAGEVERIEEHDGTCNLWILLSREKDGLDNLEVLCIAEVEKELEAHIDDFEECYFILDGKGRIDVEGEKKDVFPGDIIYIAPGKMHSIESLGKDYPVKFLAFMIRHS